MDAFPDAKVILTVRDPVKWHQSMNNTILKLYRVLTEDPFVVIFMWLVGRKRTTELFKKMDLSPDPSK